MELPRRAVQGTQAVGSVETGRDQPPPLDHQARYLEATPTLAHAAGAGQLGIARRPPPVAAGRHHSNDGGGGADASDKWVGSEEEEEGEYVHRAMMRTLSSKSLQGISHRSDTAADGGRDASGYAAAGAASAASSLPRGSLKSGSLAAAAKQLAGVYGRGSGSRLDSDDVGDSSGSPGLAAGTSATLPVATQAQAQAVGERAHQLKSPFDKAVPQAHSAPPAVGDSLLAASSSARPMLPNATESSRLSGLPSDEDWVQ